jgi:hypothetical protein
MPRSRQSPKPGPGNLTDHRSGKTFPTYRYSDLRLSLSRFPFDTGVPWYQQACRHSKKFHPRRESAPVSMTRSYICPAPPIALRTLSPAAPTPPPRLHQAPFPRALVSFSAARDVPIRTPPSAYISARSPPPPLRPPRIPNDPSPIFGHFGPALWPTGIRGQPRLLSANRPIRVHPRSSAANILLTALNQYLSTRCMY